MIRSLLALAGVAVFGTFASAQMDTSTNVRTMPSAARDAGTYHLATGTWTRKASQANLVANPDIIYNNSCSSGFYSPLSGDTYVDEGRLPSPSSPNNLVSKVGCRVSYTVNGFQMAFCTDQGPATAGVYTINFFELYASCATVIGVTPTAGFAMVLPDAGASPGKCWIVTIDLDSPPNTASLAFALQADGDGTYAAPEGSNTFGWSMSSTAAGTGTGPFLGGDPAVCQRWDGTRWDPIVNYLEAGTGMGAGNQFRIESGPTTAGCYWFGPTGPFASFYLELYSNNACGPTSVGTVFCPGDGSGTACPCGNSSAPGAGLGCLNSFGTGGSLRGVGSASLSADTVVLSGGNLSASSALFFQGTIRQNGGLGSVFGDGLRCAGGGNVRLKTYTATGPGGSATTSYPQTGDPSVSVRGVVTVPGTRTYQIWYRNAATFCTTAAYNLTNGLEIVWGA